MNEKSDLLKEELEKVIVNNKLTCAQAHMISDKLNIPLREIGEKADELGIKISKCQLGCF
ncbi:LAO/AO transport system kinase [Desulfitispora alkaliphila]|uniref:hypothetical protein n=1 Tax=Desulfitispora alkaliphila TaxID=622674 RepID=UPI003D216917